MSQRCHTPMHVRILISTWQRTLAMLLILFALPSITQLTQAAEFRSIASTAILYDAPSARAKKLFIAPVGMPVEVIVNFDKDWSKVRDAQGEVLWVERKLLAPKRTLVALRHTRLTKEPTENAALAFEVEQGVVLEWQEAPNKDWARVKHADGSSGYARVADFWGW